MCGWGGHLSIYNGKPGPCFCCADRCYLCQPLFLPFSPPSSTLVFPLLLPTLCVFSSLSLSNSYFLVLFCFSLLSPPALFSIRCPDAEKAAAVCFLKVCPVEATVPGICCWQKRKKIPTPHHRHPSPSLAPILSLALPLK